MRKYCTVEDVARYTGLPVAVLDRVGIVRMIERASAEIERMTGFVFEATPAVEDMWAPAKYSFLRKQHVPLQVLTVRSSPIISVNDLQIDGESVDVSTLYWVGDRIYLTPDSPVQDFGVNTKIHVEYTHGITDESIVKLVNQLCVVLTALEIADSPMGVNELFKNSVFAELSAGDVRPESFPQDITAQLVREANRLFRLIPKRGEVW